MHMQQTFYTKAIDNTKQVLTDIGDLPELVKQSSGFKFQEMGNSDQGDLLGMTLCNNPVTTVTNDDYDFNFFSNHQTQNNLDTEIVPIRQQHQDNFVSLKIKDSKTKREQTTKEKESQDNDNQKLNTYLRKRTPLKVKSAHGTKFLTPVPDTRNSNNNKLLRIMLDMFEDKVLTELKLQDINQGEKYILSSLMKRKFNVTINPEASNNDIVEIINREKTNSKTKRLEENYKLVFKKGLKFLLSKFKTNNNLRLRKYELETQFYNYYFKDIFEKEKISDNFYLSGRKDKSKKKGGQCLFNPKTINSKYVMSIMKSKQFYHDFINYINKHFEDDYSETRELKISKVLQKCYEFIDAKKNGKDCIKQYIEDNPKCKLPWSNSELTKAKDSVAQLLENKLKKTGSILLNK